MPDVPDLFSKRPVRKAGVFDREMSILGGAQREVFAFAKAFKRLGYDAEIILAMSPAPSPERITRTFGSEFADIPVVCVEDDLDVFLANQKLDVFLNQSYRDVIRNPAPFGIYRQMFPNKRIWKENAPQLHELANTYSLVLNNSSYTQAYTELLWDVPKDRNRVLLPPLADDIAQRARGYLSTPPEKVRKFICLGRFIENKKHGVVIEGFIEAQRRDPALSDWKLVVMGTMHPDDESREYFARCQQAAEQSNGSVTVEADVPFDQLTREMASAFGFAHAMGAFEPPGESPGDCEHFGLCTLEAMAHGCIPLVYARSGIFDVLDVDRGGIPFITFEGLVEGFSEVAAMWQVPVRTSHQRPLIEMALSCDFDHFCMALETILKQEGVL